MPTVLLRISLICHLLKTLLHYFLPKKLSFLRTAKVSAPRVFILATPPGMDPSELKRVFQMFDRNGDGRITKKELSDSLENLGIYIPEGDLEAMIEKIDANGDGCVDVEEFGALYQNIMDERDEEEDMREAFNVFDQNGDGFITVEELRSVLASLGLKQGRTVEDCRRMISKVDADGDGMVNFKEFKQMMRGGGFAALS
ncbi:calmodulin-like protein 3 [Elaeis guineensis]|uniref:Calmodulin-like protein 3 n=1 Tax=Elaeis guineensis var. tenera TaxID=51953 RepID=A0A6J0PMG9_ELAGV|nr:calmodulin-like protein 3 [Elaeis guineensis]